MQANKIITSLGTLTPAELIAVRAACTRLLGEKTQPAATASPLYDALLHVTGQKLPYARFRKSRFATNWKANEQLVLGFVHDIWPEVKLQVPLQLVLRWLVQLLADDMRRCGQPTELGALAVNLHTIPDVYEYAFPGYRAAGLSHVVLAKVIK